VISGALRNGNLQTSDLVSVGITNQRETTLLWDRKTGKPLHRVWRDIRTDQLVAQFGNEEGQDRLRPKTGCRSRHISPPQAALAAAQRSCRARQGSRRRRAVWQHGTPGWCGT
jgi:glycerol kinase